MSNQENKGSQEEVWDKIAPEWHEFRQNPKENIINFLKKQQGKVLDLGSGSGRYLTKIKNGEMYLVDFSKEMIKLAEKKAKEKKIRAKFKVANLTNLPFRDNFFDSAIFIDSLHCLPNKREKAIKELYRVLKPNAKAKISVWNKQQKRFKNSQKEKLIGWKEKVIRYYYLYDEKEIHDLFKKLEFKILDKEKLDKKIVFIVKKPTSS